MSEATADEWREAMQAGDFSRAWQISQHDLRRQPPHPSTKHTGPRHLQRIWDGRSLRDQRVLVRCYHGLGDTLQFIRFARPLRAIAREIIVWCQPELMGLVATAAGVDNVLPLSDGDPPVDFDVDLEIMELGFALEATMLPAPPYVFCDDSPRDRRRCRSAPGKDTHQLAVGLAWRAGGWDDRRSIPDFALRHLAGMPNVRFHCLQLGADHEISGLSLQPVDLSSIGRLACAIARLDLVIAVDTMVAHLAGALGIRAWTLLIHDCDWRWPRNGTTTPWYPRMTLYRQASPDQWEPVLSRVADALAEFAGSHRIIGERVRKSAAT